MTARSLIRRFRSDPFGLKALVDCTKGITALMVAMMLPVLVVFAALAVDMSYYRHLQLQLQATTDTTALYMASRASATLNATVLNPTVESMTDEIETAIEIGAMNLPEGYAKGAIDISDISIGEWDYRTSTFSDVPPFTIVNAVKVKGVLSKDRGNGPIKFFSSLTGGDTEISSTSYAFIPPVPTIHTLDTTASRSFSISGSADIDAYDAWVDSSADDAIFMSTSVLSAWGGYGVFTSGGAEFVGTRQRTRERVYQDMFSLGDLLAETPSVDFKTCHDIWNAGYWISCGTRWNRVLNVTRDIRLWPGIYNGGLELRGAGKVTLRPGIYVIRDGPLTTTGNVEIEGDGVLIIFTGNGARLNHQGGRLNLSGLTTGDLQGFVMYADRDTTVGEQHVSNANLDFSGTVYFPTGDLSVNAYMNGNCHSLCVVTRNFATTTFLNIHPSFNVNRIGKNVNMPAPLALIPSLLPVLSTVSG
ncbi:MAG: TadE/TadG family type IV pilus assembly protein [Pseudomonadota bacterium]